MHVVDDAQQPLRTDGAVCADGRDIAFSQGSDDLTWIVPRQGATVFGEGHQRDDREVGAGASGVERCGHLVQAAHRFHDQKVDSCFE